MNTLRNIALGYLIVFPFLLMLCYPSLPEYSQNDRTAFFLSFICLLSWAYAWVIYRYVIREQKEECP